MKCSEISIILNKEALKAATEALLSKGKEVPLGFQGADFVENNHNCIDLHIVYRDGVACVNFINEEGIRVNYDYPIHTLGRVTHKANYISDLH